MDIHHLNIFFEVCKQKSFTKAAKKLYISQSAVSIQIKKLESELNTTLIERGSKNFKLTFTGRELFKIANNLFEKINRMENEISKIVNNDKPKIVIGATHNIGEPLLPQIIAAYSQLKPSIQYDLYIKNPESLIKNLKDGILDIILLEDEYIDTEIKFLQTDIYPYVLITPPNITNINQIKKMNFLKKENYATSKYLNFFQQENQFKFKSEFIVNGSNAVIKNLVMNNMGVSILPYYCVYQEIEQKNKFIPKVF